MNNQPNEVGYVVSNRDFLVHLDGFPSIRINDMVQSDNGARGWVNSIGEETIEVLMLDDSKITPNQMFARLNARLAITVGDFLLGRSINPLGLPIDGKTPLSRQKGGKVMELDKGAPGIESREFITQQFFTGITLVDSLIPIGHGQRELVIGDAHSGKTSFLIDLIVNQKGSNTVCIYASIGKPAVSLRNFIDALRANGALDYTVVIATSSSEPAPLIFLTPKTAFTVAEHFQREGKDVLLILDDLGSHAKVYREISLLGEKAPGRESYPGDIFYQQSHLLERAGNFLPQFGGGSITAFPVIELNMTDFTTLIPTNLMSMTDGHLLFKSSLRSQGQSPAIDISLSVSRVGRQTQDRLSNIVSSKIRQLLESASDLETIARFSTELSLETQLTLRRRDIIFEFLKQDPLRAVSKQIQIIMLTLPFTTFFQNKTKNFAEKYQETIMNGFLKEPGLLKMTKMVDSLASDEELIKLLEGAGPILTKLCPV